MRHWIPPGAFEVLPTGWPGGAAFWKIFYISSTSSMSNIFYLLDDVAFVTFWQWLTLSGNFLNPIRTVGNNIFLMNHVGLSTDENHRTSSRLPFSRVIFWPFSSHFGIITNVYSHNLSFTYSLPARKWRHENLSFNCRFRSHKNQTNCFPFEKSLKKNT